MEELRLPSPIPPAHLRIDKPFRTSSVQRLQNDVGNNSRGPHGRDGRSPGPGRRSRNAQKPTSPKIGYSQSHNRLGLGRPGSPSPAQTPIVFTLKTQSSQPERQLTFVEDTDHGQQAPEVIVPRATHPDQNKKVVNQSDDHHPDHNPENHRPGEEGHHRSQSQQRPWSTEPESDRSPERSGSRQGPVHRFTTRIPARSRSRAPTPVLLERSVYPRLGNKYVSEPPSSECLTGDEVNQAPIQSDTNQTLQPDVEDRADQEGEVTANLDRQRLVTDAKAERMRLVKDRDRRIRLLEDELAAIRRELDNERQQRMRLELKAQTQQGGRQSRMIQAEYPDEDLRNKQGDITGVAHDKGDIRGEKEFEGVEKHDRRRKEKEDKWNELQSDIKKVQEVLTEVRGKVERSDIQTESKPGIEKIIEEFRRENAQQRELLKSLSETWRADSARREYENIDSREKVPLNAQTYPNDFSAPVASEVLMLLGEVGKLREERRTLQHELGSLLCLKSKYGPGGAFNPDWTPSRAPPESSIVLPPEPLIQPPDLPQQTKLSWRIVCPKLVRTKKKETITNTSRG